MSHHKSDKLLALACALAPTLAFAQSGGPAQHYPSKPVRIIVPYPKLPYDPLRDFAWVTNMAKVPVLLVVHPSLPARNVKEIIALAKAKPGTLAYGSAGIATSGHLAGELFKS